LPLAGLLYLAVLAPFFASGLVVSTLLTRYAARVHRLYFWDLTGAGIGCFAIFFLPRLIGAERTLVVVAGLAAFAALLLGGRGMRGADLAAWGGLAALLIAGFFFAGDFELKSFASKRGVILGPGERPRAAI